MVYSGQNANIWVTWGKQSVQIQNAAFSFHMVLWLLSGHQELRRIVLCALVVNNSPLWPATEMVEDVGMREKNGEGYPFYYCDSNQQSSLQLILLEQL